VTDIRITIEFSPWGRFHARKKPEEISRWLRSIGDAGTEAFRSGMGSYPPPSSPGAWPNSRSGRLKGSIRSEVTSDSVTIGTSMPYSGFLRTGTSKMARRKMSDNALEEGVKAGRLGHWVEWSRL
jgi:phage gpG-like protein